MAHALKVFGAVFGRCAGGGGWQGLGNLVASGENMKVISLGKAGVEHAAGQGRGRTGVGGSLFGQITEGGLVSGGPF